MQLCITPKCGVPSTSESLKYILAAAAGRLSILDKEVTKLQSQQESLSEQWEREKEEMGLLQTIKEEVERVNLEIQQAEREYDLNRYITSICTFLNTAMPNL